MRLINAIAITSLYLQVLKTYESSFWQILVLQQQLHMWLINVIAITVFNGIANKIEESVIVLQKQYLMWLIKAVYDNWAHWDVLQWASSFRFGFLNNVKHDKFPGALFVRVAAP